MTRLNESDKASLPLLGRRKSRTDSPVGRWERVEVRTQPPSMARRRWSLTPSTRASKRYTTLLASGSLGPSSLFPTLSSDCLQLVSERQVSKRVKLSYGEPQTNCRAQLTSWRVAQMAKVGSFAYSAGPYQGNKIKKVVFVFSIYL